MIEKWVVKTDGGSPVNPGPAAYAFTVESNGIICFSRSGYLENASNNAAEYRAVQAACLFLLRDFPDLTVFPREVEIKSDSQLVVNQLNGTFAVKAEDLKQVYEDAKKAFDGLAKKTKLSINWFPREENKYADELCNIVLRKRGYVFSGDKKKPKEAA